MTVLLTGAGGFIGSAVLDRLTTTGRAVRSVVRATEPSLLPSKIDQTFIADFADHTDWTLGLEGVTEIIHLAALVHLKHDKSSKALIRYRKINVDGTLNLARQAAKMGVRRFLYVSSIKVNGESTQIGKPFKANDLPAPLEPYGISKMEAEEGLRKIEAETGMKVVVVRPPIVYGPGVRANFASLIHLLETGLPLPFGVVHNFRSMVALDNLVDLLITCLSHSDAVGQTFLVSDGEDVSTPELLRRMADAMGKKALLFSFPVPLMKLSAALVCKQAIAQRLFGSLQVDIEKTRRLLGWNPPISLDEGLTRVVQGMRL